jgi:hypothetical protein
MKNVDKKRENEKSPRRTPFILFSKPAIKVRQEKEVFFYFGHEYYKQKNEERRDTYIH